MLRNHFGQLLLNVFHRVRVWLVTLASTKLVKENEPEENP